MVAVAVHKSHNAVTSSLEARKSKVSNAIGKRKVKRFFLCQHRNRIKLMRNRIAVLFKVAFGVAFRAHQVKADTREGLLFNKRIRNHHVAANRQRVDDSTRREHELERLRKRIAMQVLDATSKCQRICRSRIKLSARADFENFSVGFGFKPLFNRRRTGNGTTRDRRIDPFVKFNLHIKFIRMVCSLWRRIHGSNSRRQLVFGATGRSHLRCTSNEDYAQSKEICKLRKLHYYSIKSITFPMRV